MSNVDLQHPRLSCDADAAAAAAALNEFMQTADDEAGPDIDLGSDDSMSSSSSSSCPPDGDNFNENDDVLTFGNGSEGESISVADAVDQEEQSSSSAPNYGQLTEAGYIHPDGHEETWYPQEHWTTLNPGPRGPPAVFLPGQIFRDEGSDDDDEEDFGVPVPIRADEKDVAAAMTKLDLESASANAMECTCNSSSLTRASDDPPYFDHEKGFWYDPGARDPKRSTFPFNPNSTKDKRKQRQQEAAAAAAAAPQNDATAAAATASSDADAAPLTLSVEVPVPACDRHYPVSPGILDEGSLFTAGARFLKRTMRTREITPSASGPSLIRNADNDNDDDAMSIDHVTETDVEAADDEPPSTAEDSGVEELATAHYTDQALSLRLIAPGGGGQDGGENVRKMNIHAPPADWADRASVRKLNRWFASFRERQRRAAGLPGRRNAWTEEEVACLREEVGRQLREGGKVVYRDVLEILAKRWPQSERTYAAVVMAVGRYRLLAEAKGGGTALVQDEGEDGLLEQSVEEAENGEADVEDNDEEASEDVEKEGPDKSGAVEEHVQRQSGNFVGLAANAANFHTTTEDVNTKMSNQEMQKRGQMDIANVLASRDVHGNQATGKKRKLLDIGPLSDDGDSLGPKITVNRHPLRKILVNYSSSDSESKDVGRELDMAVHKGNVVTQRGGRKGDTVDDMDESEGGVQIKESDYKNVVQQMKERTKQHFVSGGSLHL